MTTWKLDEDADLARALIDAVQYAEPDGMTGIRELAACATPGNGYALAHLAWPERQPVAKALRACADAGHADGDRLRDLASALDDSLAAQRLNQRV